MKLVQINQVELVLLGASFGAVALRYCPSVLILEWNESWAHRANSSQAGSIPEAVENQNCTQALAGLAQ